MEAQIAASGLSDEQLVDRVRANEAPLPRIRDRWGNSIEIEGYGGGDYYRLSRQPTWLIRHSLQEDTATQEGSAPTRTALQQSPHE